MIGFLITSRRLLTTTSLMFWVCTLLLWNSVTLLWSCLLMKTTSLLTHMPMYFSTTLLVSKHSNFVKTSGNRIRYICQDLKQKNMINIFANVWLLVVLKLCQLKMVLLFILKVKNFRWLMLCLYILMLCCMLIISILVVHKLKSVSVIKQNWVSIALLWNIEMIYLMYYQNETMKALRH